MHRDGRMERVEEGGGGERKMAEGGGGHEKERNRQAQVGNERAARIKELKGDENKWRRRSGEKVKSDTEPARER